MKKKMKNPFKMWGSYVGFALGFIFTVLILSIDPFGAIHLYMNTFNVMEAGSGDILLLNIISGFVIGWGVEVILRKNKLFGLKK